MKKRIGFIKRIQIWGIICLAGTGAAAVGVDAVNHYRDSEFLARKMRVDYFDRQKQTVKQEVYRVVDMIHYYKAQSEMATRVVDDVEGRIKADLLSTISRIRFGKGGYIFVNRYNGDALVSNGKLLSGTKKLWEVFNKNPEKTKEIFKKQYNAALQPGGDYIYYSIDKLTDPDDESPKTSFIYGISDWKWLVG